MLNGIQTEEDENIDQAFKLCWLLHIVIVTCVSCA